MDTIQLVASFHSHSLDKELIPAFKAVTDGQGFNTPDQILHNFFFQHILFEEKAPSCQTCSQCLLIGLEDMLGGKQRKQYKGVTFQA